LVAIATIFKILNESKVHKVSLYIYLHNDDDDDDDDSDDDNDDDDDYNDSDDDKDDDNNSYDDDNDDDFVDEDDNNDDRKKDGVLVAIAIIFKILNDSKIHMIQKGKFIYLSTYSF
jgi:hypothetical protein